MVRFPLIIFAIAVTFGLSTTQTNATDHDGKPSLCEHSWESVSSTSSANETEGSMHIVSECNVISPKILNFSENHTLAEFLKETENDLWITGRLPKDTLYRYTLTIVNDWRKDVAVNLSHWEVVHSPYTRVARSFAVNIPACSYARIRFLSPWAPKLHFSPINVGVTGESGEWSIAGSGITGILTPSWFQYFSEGITIERLYLNEEKTKGCSSG